MSASDTGFAKNLSNFATLVATCESMGSGYSPSRAALTLPALKNSLEKARGAMDAYHQAVAANKHAVVGRTVAFSDFNTKVTRILNALKSSESSEELDQKVGSLVKRLKGIRVQVKSAPVAVATASDSTAPEIPEAASHSVSHLSFDARLDTFDQVIKVLSGTPEYTPNEEALRHESLAAWRQELAQLHDTVIRSEIALDQSRTDRDAALSAPLVGLKDLAADTKAYVRSVFGANSPQLKSLTGLRFV